jgi:hypothetical protein
VFQIVLNFDSPQTSTSTTSAGQPVTLSSAQDIVAHIMDSERLPDVYYKLDRSCIEQLIQQYETQVDSSGQLLGFHRRILEHAAPMFERHEPSPDRTQIMSAIAFHIAAATHKMAQGSMMISRFKTLKGERFASREESAKWDQQLHSLSCHFQQRDALFRRVASLCSRFEVVPSNPRELDEIEQETVEALQREMVDALLEYWQQDTHL